MGVPKFYRWMSERYPCLSETVKEFQIPEFDNLYLDMNGIIHICSHPEDDNPHFRITEEKIFQTIFHYIEFLFRMIKPKKVFYMAVDGVAPRAKMNQQRGRRFRSAREAEELIKKAQEKGEVLPEEKRFDSNCITPGTPFMVRLQDQLKYFCVQKVSTDPLWQGPRIFISGHETPGEGEHKIMDFIRYERSMPDYDPNTRHCLYGLDADLIILGMATHDPHFSLLREEVRFGGKRDRNKRPATPEETTFHLLHLSLLREYLDYEFGTLKDKLPFPYDLEGIIDDWILMGFLVGNDFIPHLPNLHINHDALPYLWRTYEKVLPKLDGFLNEGGHLNLRRFEKYLEELAKFDIEKFSEQFSDMKWLESKVGKKPINEAAGRAAKEAQERKERKKSFNGVNPFAALSDKTDEPDSFRDLSDSGADTATDPTDETTSSDLSDDDVDIFDAEFRQHKRNYYMDKLDYEIVTQEVLQEQARGYVRAIQWILLYYFEGTPSWSWFYPHHYAPYISDVKNFKDMRMDFDISEPFLPFQQLMAVLPAASKDHLPPALQSLMTEDSSPVIDFYPVNFKTDLNGKQQDWEAVVLIPFIQEKRLLEAMKPKYELMTKAEIARNQHGPSTMFVYSEQQQDPYLSTLPGVFPDINGNHARMEEIPKFRYRIDGNRMKKGLLPSVRLEVYFPGFPTLMHIKHTAELKKMGVKVFQMNSRGENMGLTITQTPADLNVRVEEASHLYLGECVYVGWPHMFEAKVVEVSDGDVRYKWVEHKAEKGKKSTFEKVRQQLEKDEAAIWRRQASSIKERYYERLGVNIGETEILLHALPMTGRKYVCGSHGRITLEKQFCVHPVAYALQATVKDIAVHDPEFQQFKTLEELFPADTRVFLIGQPHYGSQGEVIDIEDSRVRVNFSVPLEPSINSIKFNERSLQTNYMPSWACAQRVGISSHFMSRITGVIFVLQGHRENPRANRINIGLNLKHTKQNKELPGYTKKVEEQWMYSDATIELVKEYLNKFHDVLKQLSDASDMMSEDELFPPDSEIKLRHIQEYLKSLPCNNIKPLSTGAQILEEGVVTAIEQEVDRVQEENKKKLKKVKMQVKPHLLFRPLLNQGPLVPDQSTFYCLYDRVVSVKMGYPVPPGLRGTVIGIHPDEKEIDTLYDVVFDHEFVGGITVRCSSNRGYRVPAAALINITHGENKDRVRTSTQEAPQGFRPSERSWGKGSGQGQRSGGRGAPHMQWGSGRQPGQQGEHKREREREREREQQQRFEQYNGKGRDGGQKSGSFSNNYEGNPQFVTPKVTHTQISKRTPNSIQHRPAKSQQGMQEEGGNSEFANMWKELQAGNQSGESTSSQEPSLQLAAMALGQITPPSSSRAKQKTGPDKASAEKRVDNTKIDLQSLFDRASQQKETTDKEEFMAMMDSLELSGNADKAAKNSSNNSSKEFSDDSSNALRTMLKIGESSPPDSATTPSKTYGRQVSVQELFDGAKQQETSPPQRQQPEQHPQTEIQHNQQHQTKKQPSADHQGHVTVQGHVNFQGQPGHKGHVDSRPARPAPEPGARNPVLDLESRCQAIGLGAPGYDFKRSQGRFTSMVGLPNGARFEGSECNSKEEAAESAASVALLHLQALEQRQHLPFTSVPPPPRMVIGAPQRPLSSATSAFSPVMPAATPGFMPRGGYSQMRHPRHTFVGPPPPQHFPVQPLRQGQRQQIHFPTNQNFINSANPNPGSWNSTNQNSGNWNSNNQNAGSWNHHHNPQVDSVGGTHSEQGKKQGSVMDPAFIPLQVARNQKTPQKRRDGDSRECSQDHGAAVHDSHTSHSEHMEADGHRIEHTPPRRTRSQKSDQTKSGSGGGRKRRSRIAANLNMQ